MPQMKRVDAATIAAKPKPEKEKKMTEEEYEDHLDYCVAVESIDEALEEGGMMRTRDFARELGFDV